MHINESLIDIIPKNKLTFLAISLFGDICILNVHESGINIFKLLWLKRRNILTKVLFENI